MSISRINKHCAGNTGTCREREEDVPNAVSYIKFETNGGTFRNKRSVVFASWVLTNGTPLIGSLGVCPALRLLFI